MRRFGISKTFLLLFLFMLLAGCGLMPKERLLKHNVRDDLVTSGPRGYAHFFIPGPLPEQIRPATVFYIYDSSDASQELLIGKFAIGLPGSKGRIAYWYAANPGAKTYVVKYSHMLEEIIFGKITIDISPGMITPVAINWFSNRSVMPLTVRNAYPSDKETDQYFEQYRNNNVLQK